MENKMNFTKIIRIKTSEKSRGYNSCWLIRCNICGQLMLRWDTDMYNKVCPICKNQGTLKIRTKEEIKDSIFRIQRRLYSEYKTSNVLTAKEVSKLSDFRETEFKSVLYNLISDHWFTPRNYTLHRKKEWKISKRGEQLLKNPDFMDLLEECFNLLHNNNKEGGEN